MPVQYAGIVAEHRSVRERAGLFDVSHMGRLEVSGPKAIDAVNRLITNDLHKVPNGRALYACCCREDGGILDDLIVYRHSPERILVVCNAANDAKILSHFNTQLGEDLNLVDLSLSTGLLALQGPLAFEILHDATGTRLSDLAKFSFVPAVVANFEVLVARTGYTGEDGVEIFMPASDLVACWHTLLEAGASRGLSPIGLGARDTLRLEACLSLYGHEIDETIHPFEAGLGFAVRLDKTDFLGRSALLEKKAEPPTRRLAGLAIIGRGVARENYAVVDQAGHKIGHVTSGSPSPTLGRSIALAYLPPALTTIGTTVSVDCRGKAVAAEVVATPFYKQRRRH
jgi:aminomethyltransferase